MTNAIICIESAFLCSVIVLLSSKVAANYAPPKTFHIGYISGNRNKTTGKFDYYNLPGLKIRYISFINM